MKKKVILILCLIAVLAWQTVYQITGKGEIVYNEHTDDVAVKVDGTPLTLRDMAFYVAYEEANVEEQARLYSAEDTSEYWNLHTSGIFVRSEARNAAMDMAVHDFLYSSAAENEGITLTQEEEAQYQNSAYDFCSDLEDWQKEALGVTDEDLEKSAYRIALSEKYQEKIAEENDVEYAAFDIAGTWYARELAQHKVKIKKRIWNRVPFGDVTLQH